MLDLFGNHTNSKKEIHVNIYADEIWITPHMYTGDNWIYSAAIYEKQASPILLDIINARFSKNRDNWEQYKEKNDTNIHWADLDSLDKKFIVDRWLEYLQSDCFSERKFFFSLMGINLSNLNITEFDNKQNLNSIYNRFFRSMIKYSLKKFFGAGVIVDNIYHEYGQQIHHEFFDWHTIFKLDQDEDLNFNCTKIEFLPKSHRDDKRSNIIQLCDSLAGIFRDLHCGIADTKNNKYKREILQSSFIEELFIKRVILCPNNVKSKYGYSHRFHLSFFPKTKSQPGSIGRLKNNYYDPTKIALACRHNLKQGTLF